MSQPENSLPEGSAAAATEAPPSYTQAGSSAVLSAPAPDSGAAIFRSQFACVTLNQRDVVRFINFPADVIDKMRQVIQVAWLSGIQSERPYGKSREFKVHGRPWSYSSNGDDQSRILLLRILEGLYNLGWVLQASVDLSKKEADKDSLFFRLQNPPPPESHWLAVSFDKSDKLKVVGAPDAELCKALLDTFRHHHPTHEIDRTHGRLKIKFRGTPWWPSGQETVQSRLLVLEMLQAFETQGYTVYSSIDMTTGRDGSETDVIFVHRECNWTPGMPIWHR